MSNTNTGGPAFPLHNHGTQSLGLHFTGMTLRDYFAAKALPRMIGAYDAELGSERAYEWADAMLKAREA